MHHINGDPGYSLSQSSVVNVSGFLDIINDFGFKIEWIFKKGEEVKDWGKHPDLIA